MADGNWLVSLGMAVPGLAVAGLVGNGLEGNWAGGKWAGEKNAVVAIGPIVFRWWSPGWR